LGEAVVMASVFFVLGQGSQWHSTGLLESLVLLSVFDTLELKIESKDRSKNTKKKTQI